MTAVIFSHKGTLDKFIGDAIMATFGTPYASEDYADDARAAVAAARGMQQVLVEFNAEQRENNRAELSIGIGLHTGEVFAGMIGRGDLLEYTVIGDTVNTASRIESLCKKFKTDLIISEAVYKAVDDKESWQRLPAVKVKGKADVIRAYRSA